MSAAGGPGWLRRMAGYLLRHRASLILSLLGAVLGGAAQAMVPLVARQILDEVIIARSAPLWPWLLALVGLACFAFAMSYMRRYRGGQLALEVQYDLRNDIHAHLQHLDLDSTSRMSTGQIVGRAISDTTLVQGVLGTFPITSGNVLVMLVSLGVMLSIAPLLALVSTLVIPVVFTVAYRMRVRVFPAAWEAQQRAGDIAEIVDEDVNGVRVVKAFGQEQRELARVAAAAQRLYGARMRTVRLQAAYQPLLEAIPLLAQVAILAVGGWLTLRGHLSPGTFLAFSSYVAQFVAPSRQLAKIIIIGQQARAGVERIFQLLDLPVALAERPDAVRLGTLRGELTLRDVHFGYSRETPVLRGLNLHIPAGERVAIVGASGSGKSTIVSLIARLRDPDSGTVRVDGHDVRDVTLRSLRSQIGIAFDESFLFSDSIRANIAYGRPDMTDEQIQAAARAAQAHAFISALPDGYQTQVGERGLTLSGGQRQRIALARAILTDPQILILDDATSAVDAHTEEAIHTALQGLLAGRTTLIIAHRLSTLRLADRIVVLDGGRVADSGTHDELLARSMKYRSLIIGSDIEAAGDRVEELATSMAAAAGSAWSRADGPDGADAPDGRRFHQTVSIGAGLSTGGARSARGWRLSLAPTPELLARVAALPPIVDEAQIDIERESRPHPNFKLRAVLGQHRWQLLIGVALVALDALCGVAGPALVRIGLDDGVAKGSLAVLFAASGVYLAVALADLVTQIAETFVAGRTAERVMLSLRIRIWAQLQRLSLDYYEREGSGRIMTRMTTDVDQFETLISNGLLTGMVALVTLVGVGVALLVMNFELGVMTLSVVVPLGLATAAFRSRAARLYDQAREDIAAVNADFQESLAGVRESQAFVHEPATIARFVALGRRYLDSRFAAQQLVAIYFPFVQLLAVVADAIALGVGADLITRGQLSPGALIAFVLYIDMFFSPIQQLSQVFDSWQQTNVSVQRIAELMRLSSRTPQPDHPIAALQLGGELALAGVRFSYPSAEESGAVPRRGPADTLASKLARAPSKPPEALRNIDMQIGKNQTIALVGETGAGKSTVVKLIARFYDPVAGRVCVDGLNLRELDLADYRRQLGYVPQESFLFTGTVRDNIAYGRPSASDAEVEQAARAIGAHELIAALPGGYLHRIAERGQSLSSGQRQLIALTRAYLVDPAVLLLDEATANLDLASEARVTAAMRRVSATRTTILIAHRLQTARRADRIFMLDSGRVVESGSHEQLLAANGRYAAMWHTFEAASAPSPTGRG